MSMIFKFRALSDESDTFVRDYQLLYKHSLLDFHDHICTDLNFNKQTMASFFLSDKQWAKLQEFTLVDVSDGSDLEVPQPMESVTLRELITDNGDRLIYTFDPFGDRSLFIEMVGVYKAEDDALYPQTTRSEGEAPAQFGLDLLLEEDTIFDEAMAEFGEFEGDDSYNDEF